MFQGALKYTGAGLNAWDVSKVSTMGHMFEDASALTGEQLVNWDVSSVIKATSMFKHAAFATGLPVSLSAWTRTLPNSTSVSDVGFVVLSPEASSTLSNTPAQLQSLEEKNLALQIDATATAGCRNGSASSFNAATAVYADKSYTVPGPENMVPCSGNAADMYGPFGHHYNNLACLIFCFVRSGVDSQVSSSMQESFNVLRGAKTDGMGANDGEQVYLPGERSAWRCLLPGKQIRTRHHPP
jgi:hypothetical protein